VVFIREHTDRKGSKLNNAIKVNEPWSWGIAKRGKNRDSFKYFTILPCLVKLLRLSLAKANLQFKKWTITIKTKNKKHTKTLTLDKNKDKELEINRAELDRMFYQ